MSECEGLMIELNMTDVPKESWYDCMESLLKANTMLSLRLIVLPSGRLEARAVFENFDGLSREQKANAEDCVELWKRHVAARTEAMGLGEAKCQDR